MMKVKVKSIFQNHQNLLYLALQVTIRC